MDWINYTNAGMAFIKKYRFALLAAAAGILLLMLPGKESASENTVVSIQETETHPTLEDSLAQILSLIDGVGKTEVLLTLSSGEDIIYQTDTDSSSGEYASDRRADTVLITGEDREETGLVKQINPPEYRGAVIVCQGAESPEVRLSVVEAVMSVTGLTSDKITVLKMK